ncbi:MAG: hypothetical protein QNJ94_08620 [Alphaproteobacteria bacterium]|nr:hypothetical protein [Alphaproteobacteria bacterium]
MRRSPQVEPEAYHVGTLDHIVLALLAHAATVFGILFAAGQLSFV